LQNMSAPIVELAAHSAQQHAIDDIQMRAQHLTARAAPVRLRAAEVTRLPHDVDDLIAAVDDDAELLARDAVMDRCSNPHGVFDEASRGVRGWWFEAFGHSR